MTPLEFALVAGVAVPSALVLYAYVGYPVVLWTLARLFGRPTVRAAETSSTLPSVSVVLTVYNECRAIRRRVEEIAGQVEAQGLTGEVIVVSDGSTDGTDEVVRTLDSRGGSVPVRIVALATNQGKAAALTAGCRTARFDVLVMADVRQTWASDALTRLLGNFADPAVGAVSGELRLEHGAGVIGGIGAYWRYEKWLRRLEASVHSTVGVTGAISAVRRPLFRPIPAGTLLDDVYWPLGVVMQGHRVVFDSRAVAYDRLPDRVGSEFRRKVRTLAGNFQLAARLPSALLPWRNPVWFFLVSHKLARLAVPWAWLMALGLAVAAGGPGYDLVCAVLAGPLLLGLAGLVPSVAGRSRIASAAASVLVLNAAAWWAFWVWASGRASRSWRKAVYQSPPSRSEDWAPARPAGMTAATVPEGQVAALSTGLGV